jgi:AraC family transcriptional regulator, ethanolamine operon transcriptional activator
MHWEIPSDSTHPANPENEYDILSYARHDVFTDSNHLSAAVRNFNLDLIRRGSGPFQGDLYFGALAGTMVQFIHLDQPTISRATNAPDRLAVLVQLRGTETCVWNGYESQGSFVITYGPGQEHFGSAPGEFDCAFVSIPIQRINLLAERCQKATLERLRTGCHHLQAPGVGFINFEKQLTQLRAVIESKPMLLTHAAIRQMFEHSLEESLFAIICKAEQHLLSQDSTNWQSSGQIIRRTEQFLESYPDQSMHMMQLCSAIGVNPIALGRAFRELLNVEPKQYLRLYRLHRVRKILLTADPSETSMETVARSWGFWSRLQFEAEYRRIFGELPSQTIARS